MFCFRALPLVDIDVTTREVFVSKVKSELYIHERQRSHRPVAPLRKRRPLKRVMSVATPNGDVATEIHDSFDETKAFVMSGKK